MSLAFPLLLALCGFPLIAVQSSLLTTTISLAHCYQCNSYLSTIFALLLYDFTLLLIYLHIMHMATVMHMHLSASYLCCSHLFFFGPLLVGILTFTFNSF